LAAIGAPRRLPDARPRVDELGSEPETDDIDGLRPSVVTWHHAEIFCLIASDNMPSDELSRIAVRYCPSRKPER
jgi:hypothetical protein